MTRFKEWMEEVTSGDNDLGAYYSIEEASESAWRNGFRSAIKELAKLSKDSRHLSRWSHSRDVKFAPIELHDFLVIKYKRELQNES